MNGYTGKILTVDLTNSSWQEERIPHDVYRKFLSGVGLGAYYLYKNIPAKADPLGPENILGFVAGVLTGTGALFSGRWLVVGKSPLTGGWGDANCGGNFGRAIKACGYDGIFFRGCSEKPVYLVLHKNGIEIRDASALWGMDTVETEKYLIENSGVGKKARVACIGPAGEKRSLISGICNDRGRIAARSGLGAVMGAKKLKAVVLAGRELIRIADRPSLKNLNKECSLLLPKEDFRLPAWSFPLVVRLMSISKTVSRPDGMMSLGIIRKWGTIGGNQASVVTGDAPVKNWSSGPQAYNSKYVNPDRILAKEVKKYHCYSCPLGCGGICSHVGPYEESHKPEYETATSLGALLLNEDLDSIFYLNEYLNRAGMDSISAGGAIAFAIECYENGLLDNFDTQGLDLSWGNAGALVRLVELMVAREGIGDLFADGVKAAVDRIGGESDAYAVHAGGQELPMHDPKQDPGFGVHYLVEPTPGRHTIGALLKYATLRLWNKVSWAPEAPQSYRLSEKYMWTEEKGLHLAANSMVKMVVDGAGVCTFGTDMGLDRYPLFEYLNAVTGWNLHPDEYMEIGKRVQTLRQLFNVREGISPAEVKISGRAIGDPPLKKGPVRGIELNLDSAVGYYWKAMDWNADGTPRMDQIEHIESFF